MRTTTYERVLEKVAAARGIHPDLISANDAAVANLWINRRLRFAWEFYYWPEITTSERRQYRASYAAATTYAAGDEVYHLASDAYYQCLQASTGNAPATASGDDWETNETYWADCAESYSADDWETATAYAVGDTCYYEDTGEYYACHTAHTSSASLTPDATGADNRWGVLAAFVRNIDWEQSWEDEDIGEVKAVWDVDPQVYSLDERSEQRFDLMSVGIVVRSTYNRVYVEFRKRCPDLTGAAWASGVYAVGDTVYYSTTGDYYECIAVTTTEAPTDTTKWTRLEIPRVLSEYVAQGAAADWIGKTDNEPLTYGTEQDEAMFWLRTEVRRLELSQRQHRPITVRTRAVD